MAKRRLTKSQIVTGIAASIAIVVTLAKALLPFTALLGPVGVWLPVVVAVGAVITAAFNQSLSPNHVSTPIEEARRLGIVNKQTARPAAD